MSYLRSVEDSEKTRKGCINFLQSCLVDPYPDNGAIIARANEIAAELGGELLPPRMSRKYAMVKRILGYRLSRKLSTTVSDTRTFLKKNWDKSLYYLMAGPGQCAGLKAPR